MLRPATRRRAGFSEIAELRLVFLQLFVSEENLSEPPNLRLSLLTLMLLSNEHGRHRSYIAFSFRIHSLICVMLRRCVFTERRYASAVYAFIVCPSVRRCLLPLWPWLDSLPMALQYVTCYGFVDDVMFSHNRPYGTGNASRKTHQI